MKLIGLLESSWGGITTIRGYALLSDLVNISKVDPSYQRNLQEGHVKEISEFIENGKYRFSPEIILGYRLKYDFSKKNAKSGYNPMDLLVNGGVFISNFEKIKFSSKSLKSIDNVRLDFNIKVVTIDINDNNKIFSRIDGNHRLSAFEENKSKQTDLKVPFSIILFDNEDEGKKAERVIFNNINAKVVPLTSEENLKNILDGDLFSDEELEKIGEEYLFTKKVKETLNINVCSNIKHFFNNKERTILKELSVLLLKGKYKIETSNKIVESINDINTLIKDKKELFSDSSYSLLIAFVYFHLEGKFNIFYNWVIENHIYSLKNINHYDLIEIYKKVMESKNKEIFLAMPFRKETEDNYQAIIEVVNDINREEKLEIKIKEIRVDNLEKGYSYAINEEIFKIIENSGYLIADLSYGNINVYNELGYLMGLNKGLKLKNENFLLIYDKKSGDSNKNIGFDIKNIKQYRFENITDLKTNIKIAIKTYYNLI